MKILHIITRLDRGGSSEDVLITARRCTGPGYAAVVVSGPTTAFPQRLMDAAKEAGTSFCTVQHLRRAVNPIRDIRACVVILALLRREQPDIVHTHTSKAGIIGRWSAWLYRLTSRRPLRIVHATHGHIFYGYYNAFISAFFIMIERVTALITDRIVVLTPTEVEEHLERHVGHREQFTVIHSGISYAAPPPRDFRNSARIPPDALLTGSVGRLDPVKSYDVFIDAAQEICRKRQDMYFVLVGDGSQRQELEARIASRGLSGRCIITGWQDDPASFIAAMDIYVQPSLNEGLGKTILTAQLLGKPIVATAVQGIKSLIDDGVSGLLIPPGHKDALAAAVERLAADPSLRAALGEQARERVYAKNPGNGNYLYSEEEMIRLHEQLYRAL